MSKVKYIHGDALKVLPKIKHNTVDLVFTSPPGMNQTPFFKGKDINGYTRFLGTMCNHFAGIVKLKGWVVISQADGRMGGMVTNHITFTDAMRARGFTLKDHKILVRGGGKVSLRIPNYQHFLAFTQKGVISAAKRYGTYLKDVWWEFDHGKHDGQPVWPPDFIEMVLHTFTHEGDMVVDPFAGVGPVPQGCLAMGRDCIAVELDEDIYKARYTVHAPGTQVLASKAPKGYHMAELPWCKVDKKPKKD